MVFGPLKQLLAYVYISRNINYNPFCQIRVACLLSLLVKSVFDSMNALHIHFYLIIRFLNSLLDFFNLFVLDIYNIFVLHNMGSQTFMQRNRNMLPRPRC